MLFKAHSIKNSKRTLHVTAVVSPEILFERTNAFAAMWTLSTHVRTRHSEWPVILVLFSKPHRYTICYVPLLFSHTICACFLLYELLLFVARCLCEVVVASMYFQSSLYVVSHACQMKRVKLQVEAHTAVTRIWRTSLLLCVCSIKPLCSVCLVLKRSAVV
jgi:hypothetical protein